MCWHIECTQQASSSGDCVQAAKARAASKPQTYARLKMRKRGAVIEGMRASARYVHTSSFCNSLSCQASPLNGSPSATPSSIRNRMSLSAGMLASAAVKLVAKTAVNSCSKERVRDVSVECVKLCSCCKASFVHA